MRYKAYWIGLISALVAIVSFKNYRYYREQSHKFKITKTVVESGLLASAAAWLPGVLVMYGAAWATKPMEHRPYIRMGLATVASVLLLLATTYVLEIVVIIGVFAIELLSADFLRYMHERRAAREQQPEAA